MRYLLAGWFSFDFGHYTAGDLMCRDLVGEWLADAGLDHDVAVAPALGEAGVDIQTVAPERYSHLIFVCGPFQRGELEAGILRRFAGCRLIGLDLSMQEPLAAWQPFDALIERDSSEGANPDLAFLSRQGRVPVAGICLVEAHEGAADELANAAIERILAARQVARVTIDTRLDENAVGLRSAREVESVIAKMDVMITTRLHGTVLALKNGVPVIAIDAIVGGAKIRRQCEAIGWPVVFTVDEAPDDRLLAAFDYCLTDAARVQARACAAAAAAHVAEIRSRFLALVVDAAAVERRYLARRSIQVAAAPALAPPRRTAGSVLAAGMRRVNRRWQRLTGGLRHRVAVLMYHRVANVACDPWGLCVSPEHFDQQLAVLRRHLPVMSVDQLSEALVSGRLPRRAAVITFDDGYADNLHGAQPILTKHDLPATLFLCAAALDGTREFWWDQLEAIFLRPETLPQTLRLEIGGRSFTWDLGPEGELDALAWADCRRWSAYTPPTAPRQKAYYDIWSMLRPLSAADQEPVLAHLFAWAGRPREARPTHRMLTTREAREMVGAGTFRFGGHTVTHPALAAHPREVQLREIRDGCEAVASKLNQRVRHFAYPYGDHGDETVELARQLGLSTGFTTEARAVLKGADPFRLPRVMVGDWSGEELARRLAAVR